MGGSGAAADSSSEPEVDSDVISTMSMVSRHVFDLQQQFDRRREELLALRARCDSLEVLLAQQQSRLSTAVAAQTPKQTVRDFLGQA